MTKNNIVEFIFEGIETGELVTEGKLPTERVLASKLGVSRATVRAALDKLVEEGLIWRKQGSGNFVGARNDQNLSHLASVRDRTSPSEIMEVRKELEPLLVRYAALRSTPTQLAKIEKAFNKTITASDAAKYERWDGLFHRSIAEAANNQLFLAMFDAIQEVRSSPAWSNLREFTHTSKKQIELVKQHRTIYESIANRDPKSAEAAMRKHLLFVESEITR